MRRPSLILLPLVALVALSCSTRGRNPKTTGSANVTVRLESAGAGSVSDLHVCPTAIRFLPAAGDTVSKVITSSGLLLTGTQNLTTVTVPADNYTEVQVDLGTRCSAMFFNTMTFSNGFGSFSESAVVTLRFSGTRFAATDSLIVILHIDPILGPLGTVTTSSQVKSAAESTSGTLVPSGWMQVCTGSSGTMPCPQPGAPYMRGNSNLPYDSVRGKMLYLGGYQNPISNYSNSLWEYDTSNQSFNLATWSETTTPVCGSVPNASHPLDGNPSGMWAYDSTRGQALLTQGVCQGTVANDTWRYDSSARSWARTGNSDGILRVDATMAYDAFHDVFVTYGGANPNNTLTHFSPGTATWSDETAAQNGDLPGLMGGTRMLYDPAGHKLYLFGGYRSLGDGTNLINDLWSYDPTSRTWTLIAPVGGVKPPATSYAWMVFDTARSRLVYYVDVGTVWQYSIATNTWSQLSIAGGPTIPPPNTQPGTYLGAVGYDPGTDKFVLFRVSSDGNGGTPEVWELKF